MKNYPMDMALQLPVGYIHFSEVYTRDTEKGYLRRPWQNNESIHH